MVTEEETYENQVLPENQDAVQTKEGTNNKPNVGLRRSERPKKCALHDDDYLQDSKHDVNDIEDPMNFKQAMISDKNENWWGQMCLFQGKREMADKPYASLVGSLMYAQVCTRPDIAFSVSVLGRFQSNPRQAHWIAGKRVMRYLQRTNDYKLVYKKSDRLEVEGYADADFASCKDDLKSTSRYVFLFVGAAISLRSNKQPLTVASTMLAEFLACYEATTQAMWLKNFITSLGVVESIQ
ncbi:unnamed protein product [Prunus brigantina]